MDHQWSERRLRETVEGDDPAVVLTVLVVGVVGHDRPPAGRGTDRPDRPCRDPCSRRGAPRSCTPHWTRAVEAVPLLERERELAAIASGLDDAVAGRGGLLLVEGPAGIGKSALVARAREAAHERNVAVAVARASELERDGRLRGRAPAVRAAAARHERRSARARARRGGRARQPPWCCRDGGGRAAAEGSSFATLHGLYWLVAGPGRGAPAGLVVDDGHWADEASARFLAFLANRLEELPVLLLAAQRPEPAAGRPARCTPPPAVTVVTPGVLSIDADRAGALGDGAEPAFAAACHAATGGNPLLVRRLAVGLREHGVPFTEAGAGAIAAAGPEAVAGAVAAAMARLGGRPRRARLRRGGPRRRGAARRRRPARRALRRTPRRRPPTSSCARASSKTAGRCASSTRSCATRC